MMMINPQLIAEAMTENNSHHHASSAYRNMYETNMSGMEIVAELYKGMLKNIEAAKKAHAEGNFEEMVNLNTKTNKILMALQSNLDFEQGGEASLFLNQFYSGIFASLTKILSEEDPQARFDEIIDSIKPVYKIWCEHAANSKEPASS